MRASLQLLVDLGLATETILTASPAEALQMLREHERKLAAELARRHGHPAVVLSASTLDLGALGALSREEQERLKLLPLSMTAAELSAAVPSVEAFAEADDLSYRTGRRLKLFVAPEPLLLDAIAQAHGLAATGASVWVGSASTMQSPHLAVERMAADDAEAGVAALLSGMSSQLAQLRARAEAKPSSSAASEAAIPLDDGRRGQTPPVAAEQGTPALPDQAGPSEGGATQPEPTQAERGAVFDLIFPADEAEVVVGDAQDTPAVASAEHAAAQLDRGAPAAQALAATTTPAAAAAPPANDHAGPAPAAPPAATAKRARVVVIEDEEAIRKMMVKLLEKDGYDVTPCADGSAGVDALHRGGRPDLVITDAMLPGVHGFEICSRIKHSDWRDVPVILVSAVYKGLDHAREIQERHGADAFLEKPFPVRLLRDMVAKHLGQSIDRMEPGAGARARLESNRVELKDATERGDLAAMQALLVERVRLDPFDARARAELAGCYERSGDLDNALHAFEAAFVYDETSFDIAARLAALYGRLGFVQRARSTWQRAHAAAPDGLARKQIEAVLSQLEAARS